MYNLNLSVNKRKTTTNLLWSCWMVAPPRARTYRLSLSEHYHTAQRSIHWLYFQLFLRQNILFLFWGYARASFVSHSWRRKAVSCRWGSDCSKRVQARVRRELSGGERVWAGRGWPRLRRAPPPQGRQAYRSHALASTPFYFGSLDLHKLFCFKLLVSSLCNVVACITVVSSHAMIIINLNNTIDR